MQFCHAPDQRKSQAGATLFPRQLRINLDKRLKQEGQVRRIDADSGVPDTKADRARHMVGPHVNAIRSTLRCKLHRVAQQIDKNLLQPALVCYDRVNGFVNSQRAGQSLVLRLFLHQPQRGVAHKVHI